MIEYMVRPGYGSQALLVEFAPKVAADDFFAQLFGALKCIGTRVRDIQDLWMNDEVMLHCESDCGSFLVSRDIWGLVFIMAPDNQPAISAIDQALSKSDGFQKSR